MTREHFVRGRKLTVGEGDRGVTFNDRGKTVVKSVLTQGIKEVV